MSGLAHGFRELWEGWQESFVPGIESVCGETGIHITADRKQRDRKWAGVAKPQGPDPSDALPPARPCLLTWHHPTGEQGVKHEAVGSTEIQTIAQSQVRH